ncbi:MAG: NADP-dependent oxidoreductase [Comamonadaceae bacterium]|nr:MAG: NADP-dependent oxidoreductase [Comamonadaceae bacterium]
MQFDRYGDRDVLEVREIDVPAPGPRGVTVQIKAAGLNAGEIDLRTGAMAARFPASFPSGQGTDLAGVVVAVADDVTEFAVGDEVLGWSWERSSHAELANIPVEQLAHKPAALPWDVAGALYGVSITAWAAVEAVGATYGDLVAVSAAAGGVGTMVTQLLRMRGADVVGIASAANHEWLHSLGATAVEYGPGLADRVRAAISRPVDAFIDLFGPQYVDLAVELGVALDRINTIIAFDRAAEVGVKAVGSESASTSTLLARLADLVATGQLRIPIVATYRLADVRAAYAQLEDRHTHGKIVLIP